jgi:hypothetical protein
MREITKNQITCASSNGGWRENNKSVAEKEKSICNVCVEISVRNKLINSVVIHMDLEIALAALKSRYYWTDQLQILSLPSQLQTIKIAKESSIEDFISMARKNKNKLASIED